MPRFKRKTTLLYLSASLGAATVLVLAQKSFHGTTSASGPRLGAAHSTIDMPLENEALAFARSIQGLQSAEDCLPIHVGSEQHVGIFYLHCSAIALAADHAPRRISANFEVSKVLAPRFNFWKRVYTVWNKQQYAMHLSEHPEVVLEVYDGSSLPDSMSPQQKDAFLRKFSMHRRDRYRGLFRSLHANRRSPDKLSPAMQRISATMKHIDDPAKFDRAVWRMRIQKGQRDYIAQGLPTSYKYMQRIEREFQEVGVPVELAKIAFVESSFNLKARSKVGASGVFQIMPSTGKQYLMMRDGIDERNDPIKAARASAKLLKLNYKILGHWPLAITAYNHGVGSIKRGTKRVRSHNIEDLIDEYSAASFGFASKNFYTSYLAILDAMQESERHFPEVTVTAALSFKEVKLARSTALNNVAKEHRVTVEELAELNPDIGRSLIRSRGQLPRGYIVKIPVASAELAQPSNADPNKRLVKAEGDRS